MEITHRVIEANGVRMHLAEAGRGPLVVLCHGSPESWYSWRHQLVALAQAGYHAVAPDQWELLAPWAGAQVTVPALYVAGERDLVLAFRGMDQLLPALPRFIPNLTKTIILPGCGHLTQQERPAEVTAAMLELLKDLA